MKFTTTVIDQLSVLPSMELRVPEINESDTSEGGSQPGFPHDPEIGPAPIYHPYYYCYYYHFYYYYYCGDIVAL